MPDTVSPRFFSQSALELGANSAPAEARDAHTERAHSTAVTKTRASYEWRNFAGPALADDLTKVALTDREGSAARSLEGEPLWHVAKMAGFAFCQHCPFNTWTATAEDRRTLYR